MGIFVKFWPFYDARSPNIVMSHDPRSKFRNFLFCPNSTFNIRKSPKMSSGKALYFRSYQAKTSWGVENIPPPVPLGLKWQPIFHRPFRSLMALKASNRSPLSCLCCGIVEIHELSEQR